MCIDHRWVRAPSPHVWPWPREAVNFALSMVGHHVGCGLKAAAFRGLPAGEGPWPRELGGFSRNVFGNLGRRVIGAFAFRQRATNRPRGKPLSRRIRCLRSRPPAGRSVRRPAGDQSDSAYFFPFGRLAVGQRCRTACTDRRRQRSGVLGEGSHHHRHGRFTRDWPLS